MLIEAANVNNTDIDFTVLAIFSISKLKPPTNPDGFSVSSLILVLKKNNQPLSRFTGPTEQSHRKNDRKITKYRQLLKQIRFRSKTPGKIK